MNVQSFYSFNFNVHIWKPYNISIVINSRVLLRASGFFKSIFFKNVCYFSFACFSFLITVNSAHFVALSSSCTHIKSLYIYSHLLFRTLASQILAFLGHPYTFWLHQSLAIYIPISFPCHLYFPWLERADRPPAVFLLTLRPPNLLSSL